MEKIRMTTVGAASQKIRKKIDRTPVFFCAPFLIVFFLFTVLPVVMSLALSFTDFNMLNFPKFVFMNNYTRLLFKDKVFITGVKNTIVLALLIGPGGYLLSLMFAWFISNLKPKLRAFVTVVFYAPSISGNMYLIWQTMFSSDEYGYVNSILTKLGIIHQPVLWLQNPKYIIPIVSIVALWTSLGTSFLSFIAGFQGIDKTYYEAGAIDGIKNRWQELWFITLPQIRPQMLFSAVMSITGAFGVGTIITALCGYPTSDYAGHTIMNHLTDYGGMRFEMGYASAIATVLFALMVGTNMLVQKVIAKVGE